MEIPLSWWQRDTLKEVLKTKLEFDALVNSHEGRFPWPIDPSSFDDSNYCASDVEKMTDEQLANCCFPEQRDKPVTDNIAKFVYALREEHRVKLHVDYTYTYKHQELRILCHHVWKDLIIEYAKKHGVTILDIYTYGQG